MPMISVIVPVYNADKHLHCCIDSILAQSFTDFELLLIDDGSKDSSGRICDEYASKDSRIRVFHKENGGVSSARNLGLDNAKGEWVAMVDSDDYVKNGYLKDLYNEAIKHNADFVVQDFDFRKEDGTVIARWYNPVRRFYTDKDIVPLLNEQSLDSRGCSVGMLFSNEILKQNNITYPLCMHFGEDSCFLFRYLRYASRIACSEISNYCYIDHPGSAIHRKHKFQIEFNGYRNVKDAVLALGNKYGIEKELSVSILPWTAHFMHRAITVVTQKKELRSIPKEDWNFFLTHFKVITRKTAIDRWMISHFYKFPSILLPYLRFNIWLRDIIVRNGMNKLLNKLKE